MIREFTLLVTALLVWATACAAPHPDITNLPLPLDRYIVAGIDNVRAGMSVRAGSSPRGYDSIGAYGPSVQARRMLQAVEKEYGLIEVNAWPINPLRMHCAVLQIPEGADRGKLLESLLRDPRIRLAQPLQSFQTSTESYNDPYVDLQRGFKQMDVADAHAISRGDGVRIAVIDTGADIEHPDLRGRIASIINVVDQDESQFKRDRHGTEVVGVIAAVANNAQGIVGVAPRARLYLIKACWQLRADADPARCNSFTLAQGLVAALDAGVQIVNLSLAGPSDPLLRSLIEEGVRRGVLFVGAAPNGAATPDNGFLHQTGAIQVSSLDTAHQDDERVYAPGAEILTLLPGGHYDFASGASLATAHVTGAVALILATQPGLTGAAVRRLLRTSSGRFVSADGANIVTGVDACEALAAATGRGSCRHTELNPQRVAGAQ